MKTNFNDLSAEETLRRLAEPKDTLVLFHARPDPDAAGSAFALKILLSALGSRAYCLCESELGGRLAFLEYEQESVLARSIPRELAPERVVTVDSASPSQLGALSEPYSDKVELMIDHHAVGTRYADGLVLPSAAATGEIIFAISEKAKALGLVRELPIAFYERVYAAISADTGCFRYSSVTPETHRTAARLLEYGVPAAKIDQRLYDSKPYELVHAEKVGFDRLERYFDGRVAIVTFPYELKARFGFENEHLETLVDVARCIEGVEIGASIKQTEAGGAVRCSLRSNGNADVSAICAVFGGGGHSKAAGCSMEGVTCDEAAKRLLSEIEKRL